MSKDTTEMNEVVVAESEIAAINEAVSDLYTHTFSKPIKYDGETFEKLTFDFSTLTGGDSMDVENELQALGHAVLVRTLDGQYLSKMCARACTEKVGSDIFRVMLVKDYSKITNIARRFF